MVQVSAHLLLPIYASAGKSYTYTRTKKYKKNYRALVEQAQDDPELAQLLASANSDPSTVESKMRSEMDALHARITGKLGSGEDAPPQVFFRPFDPFDLWVWIELYTPPTSSELEMAQEVINSWFMLGRLGAYNSTNLQVLYSSSGVGSVGGVGPARGEEGFEYDVEEATAGGLASTMHDMSELETRGPWVRFWVDMGTSDELGLDVLVNALLTFSKEHVGVRQIVVGGVNDDWATPDGRYVPEVSIDPMRFTS